MAGRKIKQSNFKGLHSAITGDLKDRLKTAFVAPVLDQFDSNVQRRAEELRRAVDGVQLEVIHRMIEQIGSGLNAMPSEVATGLNQLGQGKTKWPDLNETYYRAKVRSRAARGGTRSQLFYLRTGRLLGDLKKFDPKRAWGEPEIKVSDTVRAGLRRNRLGQLIDSSTGRYVKTKGSFSATIEIRLYPRIKDLQAQAIYRTMTARAAGLLHVNAVKNDRPYLEPMMEYYRTTVLPRRVYEVISNRRTP